MLKASSTLRRLSFAIAAAPALWVVACASPTAGVTADSTATASTSDDAQALTVAQESFAANKTEIDACFTAFEACKTAGVEYVELPIAFDAG